MSSQKTNTSDWRIQIFGEFLQENLPAESNDEQHDEEAPQTMLVSTTTVLDKDKYDYIAVFIGADYCPHCKEFAPTVGASSQFLDKKRCKTIFVSNDRTPEAFEASCTKNARISFVMPYDLEKTRIMRELFDLKTIPALMILRNDHFQDKNPIIVTNARHLLAADPEANHFPWAGTVSGASVSVSEGKMPLMDRLVIRGKYGKWWELGHHSNPEKPDQMYMDEHAVRIRAGLLNIVSWLAIVNIFFWKEPLFVRVVYPLVGFEFIVSANIGLTPVAPIGTLATVIAFFLQPEPHWKPAKPKRFAWYIGLVLASSCLLIYLLRDSMDDSLYRPLIGGVAMMCNFATFLESSAGFCLGCFVYNTYMVPMFKLDECHECKL